MTPERKTIEQYVSELHINNDTLKEASTKIERLISQYGENSQILMEGNGELSVYVKRLETDYEMADRIKLEKDRADAQKNDELRQLAALQAKYPSFSA